MDPDLETRYSVEKEKQSGAAFCCSCVVLLFTTLMEALIDPWSVPPAQSCLFISCLLLSSETTRLCPG